MRVSIHRERWQAMVMVLAAGLWPAVAHAQTVYVDVSNASGVENGSQANPYNTIQEGVNAAGTGATVQVASGLYGESLVYVDNKRDVTIAGASTNAVLTNGFLKMLVRYSANVTVRGLTFRGGQQGLQVSLSTNVIVSGNIFEGILQNAYASIGAFIASSSSIALEGNVFRNNYGGQYGGAGYISYCSAIIRSNDFINNYAWNNSGALRIYTAGTGSVFRMCHNYFENNRADYSAIEVSGNATPGASIDHNVFFNNGPSYSSVAGAVRISMTGTDTISVVNNVFKDPYQNCCGGSKVGLSVADTSAVYVANNIFYGSNGGYAIWSYDAVNPNLVIEYNDIFGMGYINVTPGAGSISSNPLFVNPAARDYSLQAGSPCINAGNPATPYNDGDGSRNDMGIFGGLAGAPANQPPTANAQGVSTAEDAAKAITLTGSDPENAPLTFLIVSNPAKGSLSGTPPNVTYTPSANSNGVDSFTFAVSDGAATSAAATVTVTVTAVNDAPVADIIAMPVYEDTPTPFTLSGSDVDGDALSFAVTQAPAFGTLSGTPPNLTYTPGLNFTGNDEIRFTANDGQLTSNTGLVSFTVNAVNDAPVANSQSVTTAEDTVKSITLTATDVDSTSLTYSVVSFPASGTLSGAAPNVTYTPGANFNGSDSFTFRANDGLTNGNIATVAITVTAVNDAPVAQNQGVSTPKNVAKAITLLATDIDSGSLTYAIASSPGQGTLSGTPPNVMYTPVTNFTGVDSFTFRASDGSLTSAAATVSITVTAPSTNIYVDAANATGIEDGSQANPFNTIQEGVDAALAGGTVQVANGVYTHPVSISWKQGLTLNGSGTNTVITNFGVKVSVTYSRDVTIQNFAIGGGQLHAIAATACTNLVIRGNLIENVSQYAYNSVGALSIGSSSFTIENNVIRNNYGGQSAGAGAISGSGVIRSNDFINNLAWNSAGGLSIGTGVTGDPIRITGNYFDTCRADNSGAIQASGGNAPLIVDHNVLFNCGATYGYGGAIKLFFTQTGSTIRIVNNVFNQPISGVKQFITTYAAPSVYIANNIFSSSSGGTAVLADPTNRVVMEYNDVYGMSVSNVTNAPGGLVSNPLFVNTAARDYRLQTNSPCINAGNPSSQYNDADGSRNDMGIYGGWTTNAAPANNPPVAQNKAVTTLEDRATNIIVVATDPETNTLTYSIVASPASGVLSGALPNVTYTPTTNFYGTDSFTFRAFDGSLYSGAATVTVTVTAVNDAPVAQGSSVTAYEDTQTNISMIATDVDSTSLTYTVVANPTKGTLSGTGATRTYTPSANTNGSDSFTFRVTDGALTSAVATVTITLNAVNDAPVAQSKSVTTVEDRATNITFTATDIDSTSLTYSVVSGPARGTLSGTPPNVTYTPLANSNGVDTFTYRAYDGALYSGVATVTVTVTAVNDAPVAQGRSVSTPEDSATNITLVATDVDNVSLTYSIVANPTKGTLSGTAPNVTYTPFANTNGTDTFRFRAYDGALYSGTATVTITIGNIDDAPVANTQQVGVARNTPKAITLTGYDPEGVAVTFLLKSTPTNGILSGTAPNLTYTPYMNALGNDAFQFCVRDTSLTSAPATVSIAITNLPSLPVAYQTNLAKYATAQTRYFTSTQAHNRVIGFTHAFFGTGRKNQWRNYTGNTPYFPAANLARGYGSHVNINEVTLRFLSLAAAYKMNWLTYLPATNRYAQSWGQVLTGLQTLRTMQTTNRVDQYYSNTFYRAYLTCTSPNDRDRTRAELAYDGRNEQSSDDNALPWMNLLLLQGLASDTNVSIPDRAAITSLCSQIRGSINLRRFVINNRVVHNFTNNLPSAQAWDRRGAEGAPVAASLLLSGQVTTGEFYAIVSNMYNKTVNWTSWYDGTIPVQQATYHSAMFIHGLRALHGMPISPAEFTGVRYMTDSLEPIFAAHMDFAARYGLKALGSQAMSQKQKNYPLFEYYPATEYVGTRGQCQFPGNETNNMPVYGQLTGASALARSTAPHAWFMPLVRWRELYQPDVTNVFGWMQSYEASFFKQGSDTNLGWEAVIPWTPTDTSTNVAWTDIYGRVNYSDWGRPFEALNSAYTILSIFDALNPDKPLASYSPEKVRLGHIAAFIDSGTPLPPALFP